MSKSCPNFYCLRFKALECKKYPGCEGCPTLYDCNFCNNQAEVVEGGVLSCSLKDLPERCRICHKRSWDNYPEGACAGCTVNPRKIQPKAD